MVNEIDQFVRNLAHHPNSDTVKNPYLDAHASENLKHYLEYMFKQNGKRILLIGEAPGRWGCRITGIPFTSGRVFEDVPHSMLLALKDKVQFPCVEAESTATIVWAFLSGKDILPLFWNSFPFHPHWMGNENSNRAPTQSEVDFGLTILGDLCEMYNPDVVAGIGRKGETALRRLFPDRQDIRYIRHPSNGGKPKFIDGMNKLID